MASITIGRQIAKRYEVSYINGGQTKIADSLTGLNESCSHRLTTAEESAW